MNYKITITNDGNHISNPLLKLRGNTYATREEACEAIYAAMYDVIDSENGCEMVEHLHEYEVNYGGSETVRIEADCALDAATEVISSFGLRKSGYSVDAETRGSRYCECRVNYAELNNLDGNIYADYDWDYEPPKTLGETLVVAKLDDGPTDRYIAACHDFILREGYATEDGVTATVEETRTLLDELHNGSWPVDACLRWNDRDDITIESGLIPNEYSHEIKSIKNDGACGWDFEDELTDGEISVALDYICATVEECAE